MPTEQHYTSLQAKWKAEEERKLAALQKSIAKMLETTRRYCFEMKYGKIHLN